MFTAIKTATDVSSRTKGLDMLKCWQQKCVTLIADGDLEQVKIRDMKLELNGVYRVWQSKLLWMSLRHYAHNVLWVWLSIKTFGDGHVFVAELNDGTLLLYDKRIGSKYSVVSRLKEKRDYTWSVNVHMKKMGTIRTKEYTTLDALHYKLFKFCN